MNYYCLQEPQKRLRYRKADHFPEVAADIPEEIRGEMSLDLECSRESRAR
jgi:hypothetical protein